MAEKEKWSNWTEGKTPNRNFLDTKKFKFGCLPLIILGFVFLGFIYFHFNPFLPEALPDYPNGTKLSSDAELPGDLLSADCYRGYEGFSGEKYQAYATTDGEGQVHIYYKDTIAHRGFDFIGAETPPEVNIPYVSRAVCYSHGVTGVMFGGKLPALAIRILYWDRGEDAKYITQYFPKVGPKMNVVLLIQGFKYRTLG